MKDLPSIPLSVSPIPFVIPPSAAASAASATLLPPPQTNRGLSSTGGEAGSHLDTISLDLSSKTISLGVSSNKHEVGGAGTRPGTASGTWQQQASSEDTRHKDQNTTEELAHLLLGI